jgi:DNA-binding MarR family transcriptional regulator
MRIDEAMRHLGITAPQFAVLVAVDIDPGLSNADLARAAFVTPQTMQGIVANLERDGLLKRRADPGHGRILRSELTHRGRGVLERAHSIVADIEAKMATSLSRQQVDDLTALLTRCVENLQQE